MGEGNTTAIISVLFYLVALLGIGFFASRRMKDVREYFAAGKRLGFLSVAFSARATGESGWLLLGLTGMGAAVGLKAFWVVFGELLGVAAAWMLLSRRFKRLTDRYDSITIPDYLESRFADNTQSLRLVAAGALAVFVTIYVSAQFHATGLAFRDFLGWDYFTGVLVGFGVVVAYSTSGGFLAVVWSDVLQGIMMVLGLVVLPVTALVSIGGWEPMMAQLNLIDPHLTTWSGAEAWGVTQVFQVVALLAIGLGFLGSPQIFVRFLSLRSENEINKGTWVAIVWTLLADSGAVLIGMAGRALLTGPMDALGDTALTKSGEGVLEALVHHQLPFLEGLFIAVVLAAIMSTVDSLLVLASSAVVRDYHQKVRNPDLPDDSLVPASRIATFVIAIIALLLAIVVAKLNEGQTVFWFAIFGWSGIAATFCPTLILSLFWTGFTQRGALLAMIAGFFSVPFFKFVVPLLPTVGPFIAPLEELAPAFLVSFLFGLIFSVTDHAGRKRIEEHAKEAIAVAIRTSN